MVAALGTTVPLSEHAACYGLRTNMSRGPAMKKPMRMPPITFSDWIEFCWLLLIDPAFQASRNKRKTYFDYRLGKHYHTPFS